MRDGWNLKKIWYLDGTHLRIEEDGLGAFIVITAVGDKRVAAAFKLERAMQDAEKVSHLHRLT